MKCILPYLYVGDTYNLVYQWSNPAWNSWGTCLLTDRLLWHTDFSSSWYVWVQEAAGLWGLKIYLAHWAPAAYDFISSPSVTRTTPLSCFSWLLIQVRIRKEFCCLDATNLPTTSKGELARVNKSRAKSGSLCISIPSTWAFFLYQKNREKKM